MYWKKSALLLGYNHTPLFHTRDSLVSASSFSSILALYIAWNHSLWVQDSRAVIARMLFKLLQKCTMCKSRVHAVSHFRASQRQHAIFLGIGMWMTASQYSELTKFKKLKQESNYKLRPLQEPRRVHRQPSLCRSARLLPKCTTLKKKDGWTLLQVFGMHWILPREVLLRMSPWSLMRSLQSVPIGLVLQEGLPFLCSSSLQIDGERRRVVSQVVESSESFIIPSLEARIESTCGLLMK